MLHKFPSLAHPQKGYAFQSDGYDHRASVNAHFRMFDTYGDGLTQHSGDWSITRDFAADYLASLATAMLDNCELAKGVYYEIMRRPTKKEIEFASSIIYKAPKDDDWNAKRKYFSTELHKVGSGDRVRHDKRYQEITDVHDGSALSIYRILIPEYADNFQRYTYVDAIREWCHAQEDGPSFYGLPAEFLKWFENDKEERHKAAALRYGYGACRSIVESYQSRDNAECDLRNYANEVKVREEEGVK